MVKAPIDGVVEYCNNDERITDVIGSPISSGSNFNVSNYNNENGNGSADLGFEITGPKGSAQVEGVVRGVNGNWTPEDMTVTFDDGSTLKIPE
ncbi:MAG: cytochrome c oxidase assembly factor Coa1 family protein [Planctomycetota bacterium]